MTRDNILDNLDDYSADQLCRAIHEGIVTLEELQSTGNLDASKRRAIKACQEKLKMEEEKCWREAQSIDDETGYLTYLQKYPKGTYVLRAEKEIEHIRRKLSERQYEKEKLLKEIKDNPNAYDPGIIRYHLNNGDLDRTRLLEIGIPERVIDRLYRNEIPPDWELGQAPDQIPEGYTEVYFWGIRGSGKTTALAAVLSSANKNGELEIAQGPGYNYMVQLVNLFNDNIATLPSGTGTDLTQYLPFTLKKPKEKYKRSVSLIELSGEIFQCFLYSNASRPMPTLQHEETFNSLLRILSGDNRKIHFFFIDYHRSNASDRDNFTQANYLNAAATFFNNPQYNIFGRTTDAIYVVITKSDLIKGNNNERTDEIREYLNNNNFKSFVESLKAKCQEHGINHGRLLATPFSLGKVYFSEICEFDDTTSRNIIDILMRRIPQNKKSILDIFNK